MISVMNEWYLELPEIIINAELLRKMNLWIIELRKERISRWMSG